MTAIPEFQQEKEARCKPGEPQNSAEASEPGCQRVWMAKKAMQCSAVKEGNEVALGHAGSQVLSSGTMARPATLNVTAFGDEVCSSA